MKLSRLLAFLPALIISALAHAETGTNDQVLVFLKSGAVEIFHHSDLKSIEMADDQYYTDHPDAGITQLFKTEDAVKAIAIADIDSVAFGNRDKVEINPDVMRFTQQHIDHIAGYDGTTLTFKQGTPQNIIPANGQKVYCDIICDQLPIGLCAVATTVAQNESGQTTITLSNVDIADIFDSLLLVGESATYNISLIDPNDNTREDNARRIAPVENEFNLIDFENKVLKVKGGFVIKFEDIVINAFRNVYSAKITVEPTLAFALDFSQESKMEFDEKTNPIRIPLGTILGVIQPSVIMGGFIHLEADGHVGIEMERTWEFKYHWQRINGESSLTAPDHEESGNSPDKISAKGNIHLNGEIFGGLEFDISLGLIGNVAGIIAENRVGPYVEGDFESGFLLESERNYVPEIYNEAKVTVGGKFETKVSLYHSWFEPSTILIGLPSLTQEKIPLFNNEFTIFNKEFPLFPQFKRTKAVPIKNKITATSDKAISVASQTSTETLSEIEPGFAIVDKTTNEIVDSVFVAPLQPNSTEPQGITSILLPDKDVDSDRYIVYPVIKYDGYVVKAAPADVKSGATLSPIFFSLSKGKTRTVGGAYTVKSKTENGKTYIQGNPIKLIHPNPLFKNTFKSAWMDVKNPLSGEIEIVGTWKGNLKYEPISLTFNSDLSGSYNGQPFTYECDVPDKGDISIAITSDGSADKFSLMSVSDKSMKLFFHKFKRSITLTKQ